MRKSAILAAALLLVQGAASAYEPQIRDIDISLILHRDGSASVYEAWDVCAASGTEWYLVRNNLGDIDILDLAVSDESGRAFVNEGEWDVDRSIGEKAGRCGIVHTSKGMELCWGVGTLGDHRYAVSYTMTNAVKSLDDYDMLHLQLVSPDLSSAPEHVRVRISAEDAQLDSTDTRIWGFGFIGEAAFKDGSAVFESSERFRSGSSVIVLMRFDKGLFESGSCQHREFQEVLDRALEGSSYNGGDYDEGDDFWAWLTMGFYGIVFVLLFYVAIASKYKKQRQILGGKKKDIRWSREIPFDGDLALSCHILRKLNEEKRSNSLASAMILRMIYQGSLVVSKDAKGKVEISFTDKTPDENDIPASRLYKMMQDASGKDKILQEKEFSRWAKKHEGRVDSWVSKCETCAKEKLKQEGYYKSGRYTPEEQRQAQILLGLRKYLSDFTLMKEKESIEVHLWKEYLVYGALFGIADKVAKQLKDINPQLLETELGYDYPTLHTLINLNNSLARAITLARAAQSGSSGGGFGGFGGSTSFGGGGGFSGGGSGGGSR